MPASHTRIVRVRLFRLIDYLQSSLWFVPAVAVTLAFGGAELLLAIDRSFEPDREHRLLFGGGAESARQFLATIAASLITFTAVVFSITMLVLQLASNQLSPRVLRTFLRDRLTQVTMGVLVATFTYALLILRQVRSADSETAVGASEGFVPGLSIWVAFLLVVVSVGLFIVFIHHMARTMRVSSVVRRIADEGHAAIETLYPETFGEEPAGQLVPPARAPDFVVNSRGAGVITTVDEDGLMSVAQADGVVLALAHMVGDFVPRGAPLFRGWGTPALIDEGRLCRSVALGEERTMKHDAAFALRQLVDLAERALSPGVNDPTTAVEALNRVHDLMRQLATRAFPSPARLDEDGRLALYLPRPGWEDYVCLAFDEVRQYGAGSIQVARRLRAALNDLLTVAPEGRRPALRRQLLLLDGSVERSFETTAERMAAKRPSNQGHGP